MEQPEPSGELTSSPRLRNLPGYGRGRAAGGARFAHRLGSNESPEGPAPALLSAAIGAITDVNRYPDLRGETLCQALSRHHGLPDASVAVAAGSIVLLDQLIRAYCDPADEIVIPWRSYEAYPILAGLAGARLVEVALDADYRADPQAILSAVTPRCRAVVLCNPNNPTGTSLSAAAVDALIRALPREVLVILDEAYVDFAADAATVRDEPARRLARHPNLAILRTFSKAWGLAGMRIGYCLAAEPVIAAIQAVAPPFPLPGVALALALAALDAQGAVADRVAANATERDRLTRGLRAAGFPATPSRANFVWLPVGPDAARLAAHFAAHLIAVRSFAGEGVRITVGLPADTEAILNAAASWNPRSEADRP